MLVLSRQRDETIIIGDDIEITVVDIRGDKVRLGISAPARIAVHRKEVYEAIRRENEQAAHAASTLSDPDAITLGPARNRSAKASRLASPTSPLLKIDSTPPSEHARGGATSPPSTLASLAPSRVARLSQDISTKSL
jgi:carbon storage regulator